MITCGETRKMRKGGNGDQARQRKKRFLSVSIQLLPARQNCYCLCRWENYSRSRGVSPHIVHHTCFCLIVSTGLQFIFPAHAIQNTRAEAPNLQKDLHE